MLPKQSVALFIFLAAATVVPADVNVLIIGSDIPGDQVYATRLGNTPTPAFEYEAMADDLRQILEGAGLGTVNVTTRNRFAGSTSTSSFSTSCNNLTTWFYWRYGEWEGTDPVLGSYTSVTGTDTNRWAELRGENGTAWDYVVLIGDPYTIETIPGYYTLGVAKIAEEVAKGTGETMLLMPWPADGSSTNLNHYKEVVYRTGRTAGVPVAPAGLAWQAAGSPASTNHPSADGAYIAAATLYSRMFGQSATNSSYNPSPSLASNAYVTVTANQGAPQYSGSFDFNNPFSPLGDKRRHVYHTERGTSSESRLQRWLHLDILPDLNVASSSADNNYDSNTPDDDGLGWPGSWPMPASLNYGRHQASAGDGYYKSYFTNRDFWQLGFGFAYQATSDSDTYVGQMSTRELSLAYLMKEGTTDYYAYDLSAYDQQEEIASARLIPTHTLYAIINREYPDQNPMQDNSHMNRGTGRAGSTLMYTLYSGRTPIEEELAPTADPTWIPDLEYNNYVQYVGYETAWILGNVQARAPGLKVTPSTSNPAAAIETMSVRFLFPPQTNVTVSVSVSDPVRAEVSHTNLVFTPQNYSDIRDVVVRALQRNTGGNETYDVQFTTSSDDEVFDSLNDSWTFTLPANAAPSVTFTSPADGAALPAGTDLTVTVDSSDPDGSVANVTLWLNGQLVRQDATAPYQWSVGDGDSLLGNLSDDLYELKATATDNQGASFTKTVSVKVGAPEASAPAAPTGLAVNPLYSSVELNWDDNIEGDLDSYTVYRSTNSGSYGSVIATGLATSDYTDDSAVNDITYYYSVTAVDVFTNESAHSVKQPATPGGGSVVVLFGSDFQGLAGFTTSPAGGTESWSTETASVQYAFGVLGTDEAHTASLLKSYTLNRSDGAAYTFEGVVDLTDGYGDDNNRIGMLLFNTSATQTGDGGGGLYLQLNTDDGKGFGIYDGINGAALASKQHSGAYGSQGDAWIGQTLKFTADLVFTNVAGVDKIDLSFTLTDEDDHPDSLTAQVNAAGYTGTHFGFATKWRQRGVPTDPTKNVPPVIDYRSFRVTDNNAPQLTGYDLWATGWDTDIGVATNDFDFDGLDNLYEYGVDGDPTDALDQGTSPVAWQAGNTIVYVHPKRSDNTNISYVIETETDLASGAWTNQDYAVTGTNVTGGTLDFVQNEIDTAEAAKYIRLRIQK